MSDDQRFDDVDLVLAFEELEGDERRQAEQISAADPEFRARMASLRQIEAVARRPIPIADRDGFWDAKLADPADDRACRRSLARTVADLAAGRRPSESGRRSIWPVRRSRLLWPLAAALVVAVVLPLQSRRDFAMTDLSIENLATATDRSSHGLATAGSGSVLHDGDSFALGFELTHDAFVAVVHVDPLGRTAVVYPVAGAAPERLAGGQRQQIPGRNADEVWILGGEPGTETFLVASNRDEPLVPGDLATMLPTAGVNGQDREEVLDTVRGILGRVADRVETIDLIHVR